MCQSNLLNISTSLLELIFTIKDNILSEKDIVRNMPCPPKEIEDYLDKYPLPPSHFKVINYLVHNDSCSTSQIAKSLNISKSNMTPIIDKLISYDLVKRYNDPNDRRIIRIQLTPKAISISNDIKNVLINTLCSKISTLSHEDIEILSSSLDNLSIIIKKL